MPKQGKYNNTKVVLDGILFDSLLERNTYLHLCLLVPKQEISHHYAITVKPPTNHFPERRWKVDFYLPKLDIFVEAKGVRLRTWKQQLEQLDVQSPRILDRLIVVSEKGGEVVFRGNKTVSLAQLSTAINALKQEQLNVLQAPTVPKKLPARDRGVSIE